MRFNSSQAFSFAPPPPLIATAATSFTSSQGPTESATIHEVSGNTGLLIDGPITISILSVTISWNGLEVAGFIEIDGVISLFQTVPSGSITLPCYDLTISTEGLEVLNNSSGGNYIVSMFYKEQL